MGLDEIVKKSERSFDFRKFCQSIDQFPDYNDDMYQIVKGNLAGGSRAHAELQNEFFLSGPTFL